MAICSRRASIRSAIIGETPDKNTDYELFTRIPTLAKEMEALRKQIAKMIDSRRVGKDIDDNAAMLQKMDVVLEKMLKKQYEAQLSQDQEAVKGIDSQIKALTAQLQELQYANPGIMDQTENIPAKGSLNRTALRYS